MSQSSARGLTYRQSPLSHGQTAFQTIFAFLTSFLVIAILTDRRISVYDEGLILTGAMRVAAGAVPHRDFYANYGPGQFYALAGFFDAFGQTVLVERLYDAVVKAGIVCLVYAISLRLMTRLLAVIVAGVCVLWVGALGSAVYPIWPAEFFILLSLLPLFPIFDGRHSALRLFSSGLCTGGAFLFRYDMGALAVSLITIALVLYGLVTFRGRPRGMFDGTAALLLPFWCGAALIIIPLFGSYVLSGAFDDFVFQVVRFPAAHYVEMRSLPFPPIKHGRNSIVYLPPLAVVACLFIAISQYVNRSKGISNINWIVLVIVLFTVGLFFKGVVRVSPIHMASAVIPSFILLGVVAERVFTERQVPARPVLALLALPALLCVLASDISLALQSRAVIHENLSEALRRQSVSQTESVPQNDPPGTPEQRDRLAELARMRHFIVTDADRRALAFVLANTAPQQPIFVADGQNDKTVANDNSFYFLAGRRPATKWYHFDPGLQTSEAIQERIIRDLEKEEPPLIVIDTDWDNEVEPNGSAKHSGVKKLDDYIRTHYKEAFAVSDYELLRRM